MMKQFILSILVTISVCSYGQTQKPYIFYENGTKYSLTLDEMKQELVPQFASMAQQLNAQSPLRIDEITTLMSTVVVNNEVQGNYRVDIDSSEWTKEQIDAFCSTMKTKQGQSMKYLMVDANVDLMPREEWVRLYKELGIKFIYNMRDNKGVVFGRVIVDYHDF